jgi:uncharacterized protein YidB (DUF937 family)
MGLLEDVIGGVLNSQTSPASNKAASGRGGMSPMMMALLAYLAYRAMSGQKGAQPAPQRAPGPAPEDAGGAGPGGLGDILGDILGGGRAGAPDPRGGQARAPGDQGGGGLGDILGDILGGGRAGAQVPRGGQARPPGDQGGGGLGDILGDILGGGGATPGGAGRRGRSSGLDELSDIVDRFDKSGQGAAARSWVGRGTNQPVSPSQMNAVVDADTLAQLQAATGLDRDELLAGLAQTLPGVVDRLTPDGRLPTPEEWQRFER